MNASSAVAPYTLLTFAPMIDSEFSRFVLTCYRIPYREERHLFGWASLLALLRGGTLQIPLLTGFGPALAGPEAMVNHFEKTCPDDRRLIPKAEQQAAQIAADMTCFHGTLGDATAVLGYYHLLPHRTLMQDVFTRGVPAGEAHVLGRVYPAFADLFNVLLHLDAAHARDALDQTRTLFDETDRRLADGRRFLVGDRLSLSDIALATAAAPVLLPVNYGSPMPAFEQMPAELQTIVMELREHKTARFVDFIFEQYRVA